MLEKYKDDFLLLTEGGFIAVNQMDEEAAQRLFAAAALLQPKNVLPKIGLGYLHLCKLELKQAAKFFEEVLLVDPKNEMTSVLLGLTYSFMQNELPRAEKILSKALQESDDPLVKNLAHDTFTFIDKFVKKAPSPVELQAQTVHKKKKPL